jgi:hypothetical protein
MGKRWSIAALVVIAMVIAGLAQTSAGRAAMSKAGLTSAPPKYVALSFAQPEGMLSQLFSAESLLDTSFMITNRTGASRRFRWTMVEEQHGNTRQLGSGQVALSSGGHATVPEQVMTNCTGGVLHIVVRLRAPRESITYTPTCFKPATDGLPFNKGGPQ